MTQTTIAPNPLLQQTIERISIETAAVESVIFEAIQSPVKLVQDVATLTLSAGGKRLRPAFLLLAGQMVNPEPDIKRLRSLAACMEIVHMATLVHDDVIDVAATRRGKPTAAAVFGNTAAIMSGDVFLAKAMTILANDGDIETFRSLCTAVGELAEGEVLELEARGNFYLDEESHLRILKMKTASFISCCCELGAIVGGASEVHRRTLAQFGHHIGMAFQLADDLLDYRGDTKMTGKPIATDFADGQATLPLIRLRSLLNPQELEYVFSRFGNPVDVAVVDRLRDWMDQRGCFEASEQLARHHVEQARDLIATMPDTEARSMMVAISDYVLSRNS